MLTLQMVCKVQSRAHVVVHDTGLASLDVGVVEPSATTGGGQWHACAVRSLTFWRRDSLVHMAGQKTRNPKPEPEKPESEPEKLEPEKPKP